MKDKIYGLTVVEVENMIEVETANKNKAGNDDVKNIGIENEIANERVPELENRSDVEKEPKADVDDEDVIVLKIETESEDIDDKSNEVPIVEGVKDKERLIDFVLTCLFIVRVSHMTNYIEGIF